MLSINEAQALRALLAREAPNTEPATTIATGDVVQIRPQACATWWAQPPFAQRRFCDFPKCSKP